MSEARQFQIERALPVALLFSIFCAVCYGIWFTSGRNTQVEYVQADHERRIASLEASSQEQSRLLQGMDKSVSAMSGKMDLVLDQLSALTGTKHTRRVDVP